MLCALFLAGPIIGLHGQQIFNENFQVAGLKHMVISSFSGSVAVVARSQPEISVIGTQTRGKITEDVSVAYKRDGDYLLIYLRTPCTKEAESIAFDPEQPEGMHHWKNNCSWHDGHDDQLPVIDITVAMPKELNLFASTITEGNVTVQGIGGVVWAANVNGALDLQQVGQISKAKTVNGDINIKYNKSPKLDAQFSTINGDINIEVDPSLSANTSFKSFSGHFYTDLASVKMMPGTITKQSDKAGFKYRLESRKAMAINGGGTRMDFETFNGNVYLTALK